eukprot:TRINITY_DN6847_c0_g1_i1.p1 TRINITY_DN6847_c0_g1~~TRINITY_DN6847_c0_g1_i1.p1  ORF type:complete len:785 (-),score=121.20 TRINITY_DN6847_c0_g1_i1:167-2521(-)
MGSGRSWHWRWLSFQRVSILSGCFAGVLIGLWLSSDNPSHSAGRRTGQDDMVPWSEIEANERIPRSVPQPQSTQLHDEALRLAGPEAKPSKIQASPPREPDLPSPSLASDTEAAESLQKKKDSTSWPSLQPCEATRQDASSRPGRPCLPRPKKYPYPSETHWKTDLGERVVQAATGVVREEQCGGWYLFGDMTWCLNAVKTHRQSQQPDGGVIGLSYGIEERDLWSELMSNLYKVPTRLFDCFQDPKRSPPLSGKAQNGTGPCPRADGQHCYETPYQAFRVCSGPTSGKINQRKYESLESHLQGRERLSVHLKIDTEGSEWEVLNWLVNSPADMDKIRTFDMEVHLGWMPDSSKGSVRGTMTKEKRLEFDLEILEKLGKHFRCTGSSMEVLAEEWVKSDRTPDGGRCPSKRCVEPSAHAAGGFPVIQFAISYVHPDLLIGASPRAAPPARPAVALGGSSAASGGIRAGSEAGSTTTVEPKCTRTYSDQSSRPGRPCLPRPAKWPYQTSTPWRRELGDRVVAAARGVVKSRQCGGWYLFGDMTWCKEAVKNRRGNEQPGGGVIGLSYGIEQRDMWSEKMSNLYKVPTRLYDCFQRPEDSVPLAGKAPNATEHCQDGGPICYDTPYQAFRICSGPETGVFQGRQYESLEDGLKGRARLSVHLKIDTEGSEWEVLDWLLKSPQDMDKIRTFDMEVHIGWLAGSSEGGTRNRMSEQERLEFDLNILEGLGQFFRVTGSSIEVLAEEWSTRQDGGKCKGGCGEPAIHASGGFPVMQFAISFVHPDLLRK